MNGKTVYKDYKYDTVINNFTEFVNNNGGDFSKWFIGITSFEDTKESITQCYKLNHNKIKNFIIDNVDVKKVYNYFKQKGMQNDQKFKDEDKKASYEIYTIFIYKLL